MADPPELLSHIPNSGIVHLLGRRFPGIVMQGDSLFTLLHDIRFLLSEFKRSRDEERYYETLAIAETIHSQLVHYEHTLKEHGMPLPYPGSVSDHTITNDFDQGEQADPSKR